MVSREKIHELVKLFYQQTYKTFYVNSLDGKEFTQPQGVFVSLGMTTSMKTLDYIKNLLANSRYNAKIAEIKSIKIDDQFLNTLTDCDPKQYRLSEIPSTVMTKEETEKELQDLLQKVSKYSDLETISELSHKVGKLQRLYNQLEESNGWGCHRIQRDGDMDYKIFHLYVNYKKDEDGTEYRIGIYVDEKEDSSDNC